MEKKMKKEKKKRQELQESNLDGRLAERIGLVSLFNGISTLFRLFKAKAILLENSSGAI